MVCAAFSYGRSAEHRYSQWPQYLFRPNAGQQQQLRRSDRPGAQDNSISGQYPSLTNAFHRDGPILGDANARHPGAAEHRQVAPIHRRAQVGFAGPDADSAVDVQRDRPAANRRRLPGRCAVEIG
jgi:hypothetical protein